jgi:hypothetical protein
MKNLLGFARGVPAPARPRKATATTCASLLAVLGSLANPPVAAADEYAVVVNAENPLATLSRKELIKILKADTQFWEGGGRIDLLLPKSKTPAKEFLLAHVYGKSEDELKRYWIELVFQNRIPDVPKVLASDAVSMAVVRKSREALAIVNAKSLAEGLELKVLKIDGLGPREEGYFLQDHKRVGASFDQRARGLMRAASAPRDGTGQDEEGQPHAQDLERRIAALEEGLQAEETGADERGLNLGPRLTMRGFSDVRFGAKDVDSDAAGADAKTDAFALGQLDFYITSRLGERITFLTETVLAPKSTGLQTANVERVIIKQDLGSSANVQAGRFHTSLGYWNEAYHHGEWLQTSIGRPLIVGFGGDGGILPVHMIGLVLKASGDLGSVGLDAALEVGNGRGATRGSEQLVLDANDAKAVNLALGVRPLGVEGLRLGGGLYVDDIPPNASASAGPLHGTIDESIVSAFATYHAQDWELLLERFEIHHDESGADADSDGFYAQLARRCGSWTPYGRIEGLSVDDASTYFENADDVDRYLIGARWDFSTWSALKVQVARSEVDAETGSPDREETELAVQWSYAF